MGDRFRMLVVTLWGALVLMTGVMLHPAQSRAEVLQTQMGVHGVLEVDVIKAQVSGNTLTVAMQVRNPSEREARVKSLVRDFYYVDAAGKNKYLVLRDANNNWLAGPLDTSNSHWILLYVPPRGKAVMWLKFPAPPADSATINLTTPFTLPFDNLKVQR